MADKFKLWEARCEKGISYGDPLGARLRFRPTVAGAALRDSGCEDSSARALLHAPGLATPLAELSSEQGRQQSPNLLAVSDVHGVVVYAWRDACE
jgi:hypothetical protein